MPTSNARMCGIVKRATPDGEYAFADGLSLPQLRQLCRSFSMSKAASIGGKQEQGFEQAFSALGYAYLKDKAPRLLDFMVGFQLLDRTEDNTKAVGVFGFKAGRQWLMVPVFFLNGDLKGHELLYIKEQDIFVPLKENWVNAVLSQKPYILGEQSDKDVFQLGGLSPDLHRLSWPPTYSKYGSYMPTWAADFAVLSDKCRRRRVGFLFKEAADNGTLSLVKIAAAPFRAVAPYTVDLEQLCSSDWRMARVAWNAAQRYPLLKNGFDKFYGRDFFQRVATRIKRAMDAARNSLIPDTIEVPATPRAAIGKSLIPVEKRAVGTDKVRIITRDHDLAVIRNLPDEDKEKLFRHGYLVKDERTGDEVTQVYNTQTQQVLANPDSTGIYRVFARDGTFVRSLVVMHPQGALPSDSRLCVVLPLTDDGQISSQRSALIAHPHSVFVDSREVSDTGLKAEYQDWFSRLRGVDEPRPGGRYALIGPSQEAVVDLEIVRKIDDKAWTVYVDSRPRADTGASIGLPKSVLEGSTIEGGLCPSCMLRVSCILRINDRPGTAVRVLRDELLVPSTFKFVPLPENFSLIGSGSQWLGNPTSLGTLFMEKTSRMKLVGDQHEIAIITKEGSVRLPYTQALFHLIRTHGLDEPTASGLLKKAQVASLTRQPVVCFVKYAEPYPYSGPGPDAPIFPPPLVGTETVGRYNAVQSTYPQEEAIPVPGLDSARTDPKTYDPFILPDPTAMNIAQRAAQAGQKEVFDTAMLGGLLKSVRQDTMIDRHLGDLMNAVDKLGRLLFMFYWHNEDFEERYGKADMPELEDSLRNAFEVLGDVVLFLKEKTIRTGTDDMMTPDIGESARN